LIFIEHDNPDIERLHIVAQSTRLWILNALTRKDKMYASKIARELDVERKIITFHLNTLEKAGLVKNEFGLSDDNIPAAVKYYQLTSKGKKNFEDILKILKK
jgi:predicted transcriptional regulator